MPNDKPPEPLYHVLSVDRIRLISAITPDTYRKAAAEYLCHLYTARYPEKFYRIVRKEP